MAIKGNSAFPKAPSLPESHHRIVLCHIQDTHWGVLPICRDEVSVFYSPSQLSFFKICLDDCGFGAPSVTYWPLIGLLVWISKTGLRQTRNSGNAMWIASEELCRWGTRRKNLWMTKKYMTEVFIPSGQLGRAISRVDKSQHLGISPNEAQVVPGL